MGKGFYMKTFVINGKEYRAKAFDFNLLCDFEDVGISLETIATKPMKMVRAYFALCSENTEKDAGMEMEQHILSGGSFEEIINTINEQMEASDFFRQLSQTEEAKTAKNAKKKKEKSTEA